MPALRTEIDGICNLKTNEDFIVIFLEIFDSIVSMSKGSAAAKRIASTSLSTFDKDDGKLTILLFFIFFILLL